MNLRLLLPLPLFSLSSCKSGDGALCFQSEGAEVHFKQISLRPLR